MVSLCLAWVIVTAIKQKDIKGFEVYPVLFIMTGLIDFLIITMSVMAIKNG